MKLSSCAGLILGISILAMAACGGGGSEASDDGEKLRIVTSLEIFADMVRNVGGDRVEVEALLPSGADPHTFELPPSSVKDIAEANIVFINGLGLEANMEDVIRENATGPVVELTSGTNLRIDNNPHLWLGRWGTYLDSIRAALHEQDFANAEEYRANADHYGDALFALDERFEGAVGSIPEGNRKLVTFHDAFPYLAERYGLEVVAVVVPSPGQEPSAEDIAELAETIERENVPAVFKEPQFNSDVLDAAAEDANVRVLDLLSDAYIEGVDSYIELMEFNMEQLVEGLGG